MSTDTSEHSVDIDYDDALVSVPEMKEELDTNNYYVAYINITAEQAHELMASEPAAMTVDVRERYEYCAGHIPGVALSSWDSGQFEQEYKSILPERGTVILVCRSGNRSSEAAEFLYRRYFDLARNGMVYNIQAGMDSWPYAVEECPAPPPVTTTSQPWLNLLLD